MLLVLILLLGAYINPRFMPKLILKDGTSSELNSSDLIDTSSGLFVKDGASSDNLNDVRVCMARTGVTGGGAGTFTNARHVLQEIFLHLLIGHVI